MAKRIRRRSTKRKLRTRVSKRVGKRRLSKRLSKRRSKRRLSKRRVKRGGKPGRESTDSMSQLLQNFKRRLIQLGITEGTTEVDLENNEAVNDDTINGILQALTLLPNLQSLDLDKNQLTTLPDSLGKLSNLQT